VRQPMPTQPGCGIAVVVENRAELGELFQRKAARWST
jgi:hypothetical protein